MNARRIYLAVGLAAVVVYLGALWNRFAFDDLPIVLWNSFFRTPGAWWRAFASSYWPAELGGGLYRPLPIASYAVDWHVARAAWFHGVNLLWHAGASVAAAVLARRWSGDRAGLAHDRLGWSILAGALGLLCKENAAVVPALVVWGWLVGLARPSRRRMVLYAASWAAVAAAYVAVRAIVLRPYAGVFNIAAAFVGASPLQIRLTAVATLADFARLLVFPLTLRVDYSPAERTLVTTPLDWRFAAGLTCFIVWGGLLWLAWRRGRKVELFGLGWVAIALLPVANLVFPVGVLVAERTLYLPSAGLVLAAGAALARVPLAP